MKKMLNILNTITDKVIVAKANKKTFIELTIDRLTKEQALLIGDYVNIALDCDIDINNYNHFIIYIEG
jgi:hypothetical protein